MLAKEEVRANLARVLGMAARFDDKPEVVGCDEWTALKSMVRNAVGGDITEHVDGLRGARAARLEGWLARKKTGVPTPDHSFAMGGAGGAC